jgi:hypothetical protein
MLAWRGDDYSSQTVTGVRTTTIRSNLLQSHTNPPRLLSRLFDSDVGDTVHKNFGTLNTPPPSDAQKTPQ